MRKKIIGILLCLVLCGSLFTGCTLFEHNDEKDAQQVIATIDSITDTIQDPDHPRAGETFNSGARYIYKTDLISTMNNYAEQYVSYYGLTLQEATERLLDELVTRELLIIEAERLIFRGDIKWDQRDDNDQLVQIYDAIDTLLSTTKRTILSDYGESAPEAGEESSDANTTYPTPDAETSDDDYRYLQFDDNGNIKYVKENGETKYEEVVRADGTKEKVPVPDYLVWEPDESDYPCLYGDEDSKSLDREAMRQLVTRIETLADADFKATSEDKAKFAADKKEIERVMNEQGIEAVYPMLGKTYIMQYLVGKGARQSILISKLQKYITEVVSISYDEVLRAYLADFAAQMAAYNADASAYQSAVSSNSDSVLYFLDDSYFFVKHILLPFSDEQTELLKQYKENYKTSGEDPTIMRDEQLVPQTKVYPHVNGEDDKSNPKSVKEVFDEIYAAIVPLQNNPKEAERKFDELTYKYNTDTGAFGTGKSYAVKRNDDEGHSGYMEEFYDGAMELYNDYTDGAILPHYVVTDYGVHIMYLSKTVKAGDVRELEDPLTHGAYKTVRETYEEKIRSSKENAAFTNWQNERITYYREKAGVVHKYTKRYKSLYKK